MESSLEKQKKLAYVARRYYLEDQKQSDIAQELGVSRPLVSRMLSEARELGIVEITVHEPGAQTTRLMDRLRLSGSIRGGVLVEDGKTGFLFARKDWKELAEKLWEFVRDDGLSRRMGRNGRRKCELEYGMDQHMERVLSCLAGSGGKRLKEEVTV